ncbi:Transglutaminase-like superfamily protein [Rosistilla carotiformis]|uniref:Transglutaminase-like superfamily protein n=1 Tax=Rosistilla carotiformis TaxID=2528017 RepID=A0A518JMK0_9BACT|nr:transglutaminase domain-containing protein [Rosistilla carotiformis]QDV66785.1 Transglutaminase-like superfamily protein [Rosistilla carotiformis]
MPDASKPFFSQLRTLPSWSWCLLFVVGVIAAVGCDRVPQRPMLGADAEGETRDFAEEGKVEATPQPIAPKEAQQQQVEAPAEIVDRELEWWDAYLVGREPIGFSVSKVEPVGGGEAYVRFSMEEQLKIRRGKQVVQQWLKQTSLESVSGAFQEFESELSRGGDIVLSRGAVGYNQLNITVRRGDQKETHSIPWDAKSRGPFALQQSLRGKPMQPGETRLLRALMPIQNVLGTIHLKAIDRINVAMLEGDTKQLLEIESTVKVGDQVMLSQLLWANELGEVLKTYTPALDFSTFRTNRETATRVGTPKHDLLTATAIRVRTDDDWSSIRKRSPIAYRIQHQTEDPVPLFESSPSQSVTAIDGRTVLAVCDGSGALSADSKPVGEQDEIANALIQSDHPTILQMLKSLLVTESTSLEQKAETLRLGVHRHVRKKNFSRGFLSAAQVATEAEGDCTEHAILLAALCRAAGIPSRVAAGLLMLPPADGETQPLMAYHMWTLIWTGDRWQVLDATLAEPPRFADRIMVVSSDLASGNEYRCLLPVLQVMGQIDVAIKD